MFRLLFIGILFLYAIQGFTQDLGFYADVMINADRPEHRQFAAQKFQENLKEKLADEQSFDFSFEEMPWISIQYPDDRSFRVISWQLDLGGGNFDYRGFVQKPGSLFSMMGISGRSTTDINDEIPFEVWKGGIVYKILQVAGQDDIYYLLSFAQQDQFTKVKSIEPFRFVKDRPVLGLKGHFINDTESRAPDARIVMKYSADSNAGFVYDDESGRIVFENLVLVQGRIPGQGPTFVPDGSYKAFELDNNGQWQYVDKLYDQWNTGPLDAEGRKRVEQGLFARKKNKK